MIFRFVATLAMGLSVFGLAGFYVFDFILPIDRQLEWAYEPTLWVLGLLGMALMLAAMRTRERPPSVEEDEKAAREAPLVQFDDGPSLPGKPYTGTPAPPRAVSRRPATPVPKAPRSEDDKWVTYDD